MTFAKTILYTKLEDCQALFNFYKDLVGLTAASHIPGYGWCVFDTGEHQLCIHSGKPANHSPLERTSTHLAFCFDRQEEIDARQQQLLDAGYQFAPTGGTIRKNQMTRAKYFEQPGLYLFNVCDPAGNIVQFEHVVQ